MNALIDAAFKRSKVVQLILVFLLIVGAASYVGIPKESNPEVPIPIVYVSTSLDGISPEDAEDVLVGPMEVEFASLTGLKSMTGTASEGHASVQLEFEAGFDSYEALDKVREAADKAENDVRLDALEYVLDPTLDIIDRTNPSVSELLYLIELPPGDPDIMPPEDDADPLNPDQIEAIRNWIASLAA